ncbi:hypothetical protein Tco_1140224 [Tanacetum coccineum]
MASKVLEKDSKASKNKKEKYKSLVLKDKKVSSEEEASSSDIEDEEYAMAAFRKAKEEKRGNVDRKCFKCGDPNHFISDIPKHSYNDQKAFFGGAWSDSDEDEDLKKYETHLMAYDSNEVHSDTLYYSSSSLDDESLQNKYNKLRNDKKGLGFTDDKASPNGVKTREMGKDSTRKVSVDPAHPEPSARDPTSVNKGFRATVSAGEILKLILQNRNEFVQKTKKISPRTTVGNTKQPPALKPGQRLAKSKIQTRPKTPLRRPNTVFPKSNYHQVNWNYSPHQGYQFQLPNFRSWGPYPPLPYMNQPNGMYNGNGPMRY